MSAKRVLLLIGGPWDGDRIEFQSWQTFVVAPDPARGYRSDGRYVDEGNGTAIWKEAP